MTVGAGIDGKVVAQRGGWSKVATMLDRRSCSRLSGRPGTGT